MKHFRRYRKPTLRAAGFLLGLAVLGPWVDGATRDPLPPANESTESTSRQAPEAPALPLPRIPEMAAEALRAGDCDAAMRHLQDGLAKTSVFLGFYAESCEEYSAALEHHLAAEGYAGALADWRLWSLARSANEIERLEIAEDALHRLIDEQPDSLLVPQALVLGAEIAGHGAGGEASEAMPERLGWQEWLEWRDRARSVPLEVELSERFEILAWEIATAAGDDEDRREAGRRLLSRHPIRASELMVIKIFRHPDGVVDLGAILDAPGLRLRARNLIDAELYPSAVDTLDSVAEGARGLEWALLYAEALTRDHEGGKALPILEMASPDTVDAVDAVGSATRLEWSLARAALEASTARRGRALNTAARRAMRQRSHGHLRRVAELGGDPQLSRRSLRILFEDLAEEDRFEEALAVLRTLLEAEPLDTTGARHLWQLGWSRFEEKDYTGAIGNWAELRTLYPHSAHSRRGTYWSARAHQRLGNHRRSRDLLLEILSVPFDDYYQRHALARLDGPKPAPSRGPKRTESALWPEDARLGRAALLAKAGLDEMAMTEVALASAAAGVDPAAEHALRATILAGMGKRRDSIIELRRAFPDLGTPREGNVPESAYRFYYPLDFQDIVTAQAKRQELSPHLVFGMIRQESAFDPRARSWAGARGLMQLMPATGRELAQRLGLRYSRERLSEPAFSVRLGTTYFSQVLGMFGNEELALAGYNAGPYRIKRLWARAGSAGSDPELDRFLESLPFEETKSYVRRVVHFSESYRRLYEPRT